MPQYREIANELVERITGGTYSVGSLLPVESELMGDFGVSRHTIREAVRHLQSAGLVIKRQGYGTIVKSNQVQPQFKLAIRTFSDIENQGYFTHLVLVRSELIPADGALAQELGCPIGDRFLHVVSRRVPIDDTIPLPAAWNEFYVIEPYREILGEIRSHKGPVYALIEERFDERITMIEQDVSAVRLTAEIAKMLSSRAGAPGLRVKRTYIGHGGRPVMVAFNTYPSAPFTFNMRLERD